MAEDVFSGCVLAVASNSIKCFSDLYEQMPKTCAFRAEHDWLRMSLSTILKKDLWLYMAKRAPALGSACFEPEMTE